MRLLLDEHYSPKIAEALRERGHDVVSGEERHDLRGLSDRQLLALATSEGRAILTENVADFMPRVHEAAAAEEHHFGVVFTSPRSLPRTRAAIGLYVDALALMHARRADDAIADQVYWLGAA